jgi:uncharacterized protein YecE (DUF72 family)
VILPDRLFVGVPVTRGSHAPPAFHVEIGSDFADLPTPNEVHAIAGDRSHTLIGWHVLTHRRTDPRYRAMTEPPPEHAAVGHFERSRWTDEAWERTDAVARATGAQAVVLQTPPSFKPSGEHAMRLENFVAHAMRPGLALAWEWAPGAWPERKAIVLCEQIGAVPVVDPTRSAIPEGELVYLRFCGGKSGRAAIRDDDLKKVALVIRDRIGWVIFSNTTRTTDAERFTQML